MNAAFQPVGDVARWVVLLELIRTKEVDDVVTYKEMGDALDLNPKNDRHVMQMAMQRAAKQSELEDKRALEAVRNKGYRIVRAEEHLRLAKGQQKRASKALVRGSSKVRNVDFNGMDPEIRRAFEVMGTAFSMQTDMMRRLSGRQEEQEVAIRQIQAATTAQAERSEQDINELRARLEQLEALRKGER